jgi:hypothetical protein
MGEKPNPDGIPDVCKYLIPPLSSQLYIHKTKLAFLSGKSCKLGGGTYLLRERGWLAYCRATSFKRAYRTSSREWSERGLSPTRGSELPCRKRVCISLILCCPGNGLSAIRSFVGHRPITSAAKLFNLVHSSKTLRRHPSQNATFLGTVGRGSRLPDRRRGLTRILTG